MTGTLTPTMKEAAKFAKEECGGKLHRHPGGFWAGEDYRQHGKSFGTSTVEGMVKRGAAEYTKYLDGRNGRFPVEATLSI